MLKSKWRGNDTYFDGESWRYSETDIKCEDNPNVKCGHCGCNLTEEGHDGCIGTLKGVKNVCCGHGVIDDTYVQFLDGFAIHGEDAKIILDVLKKYRKE